MINLEQVSKRYGLVQGLQTSNLVVNKGEFFTLLGSSGSGKTTLLNIIAGLAQPTSGRVRIGGHDITHVPSNKRNLGMVFQNYALLPHMTVFENIAFPLRIRRVGKAEIRDRVKRVLDTVQLDHVAQRLPKELSGGQQQRVALARCIVYNPSVVLMDEPLGALDRRLREHMQVEIKRIQTAFGITMLYVTHDQGEALSMSDRIALMDSGRILQIGTPAELYFRPASLFAATFLGSSNILDGERVGSQLLRLSAGELVRLPGPVIQPGQRVSLMVRPENLRFGTEADPPECYNGVCGTLETAVMLGGVTNYHIRRPDGTTLVAQELTQASRARPEQGVPVRLFWAVSDTVVLAGEASSGAAIQRPPPPAGPIATR